MPWQDEEDDMAAQFMRDYENMVDRITGISSLQRGAQANMTATGVMHQASTLTLAMLEEAVRSLEQMNVPPAPRYMIVGGDFPNFDLDLASNRSNQVWMPRHALESLYQRPISLREAYLTKPEQNLEEPKMRSNINDAVRELEHNLADLYINHDADRQLRGENYNDSWSQATKNINAQWYYEDANIVRQYWGTANGYVYSIMIDLFDRETLWKTQNQRVERHRAERERENYLRRKASDRLRARLADPKRYRPYGTPGSHLNAERQALAELIRTTLRTGMAHPASFNEMDLTDQNLNAFYNNLMEWSVVFREWSGLHTSAWYVSISDNIGRLLRDLPTMRSYSNGFVNKLFDYADCAYNGCRTPEGNYWEKVAWHAESWFTQSKHYQAHALHVSTSNPSLLAYHQNGAKMMRNIQTQIKPGRYLQQFFADVLSEKDIHYWAERQMAQQSESELKFVPNTDPDGWVWVYEHPHGFSSCMQWDHPSRYMDSRLAPDTPYHPVRAYCHPENNLALAYLGADYKENPDGKVYARAIVNTARKTWVRVYGDGRIEHQLKKAGYTYDSSDTLKGQKLQRIELPWGGYAMPYLDGGATQVDIYSTYFKVVYDGKYDAQNSEGMIDSDAGKTCPCCGGRFSEDEDFTYVECRGESICDGCLNDDYTYAYGRRYQDYFPSEECVRCETDGEYYLYDYANDHSVYECPIRERWYHIDDMVLATCGEYEDQYVSEDYAYTLPDGETCAIERYENNFDELLAEHGGDTEDDESDDDSETDEFPCAPVVSAEPEQAVA